jgi:hypothetical protein
VDWNGTVLMHNKEKYDENCLSIDERLKYSIKRTYFTNDRELNYQNINYDFV